MTAQQATGLRRGDRVELLAVPEDSGYQQFGLSAGQRGTVDFTDSLGTLHVQWDGGRRVGIIAPDRELIRRSRQAELRGLGGPGASITFGQGE